MCVLLRSPFFGLVQQRLSPVTQAPLRLTVLLRNSSKASKISGCRWLKHDEKASCQVFFEQLDFRCTDLLRDFHTQRLGTRAFPSWMMVSGCIWPLESLLIDIWAWLRMRRFQASGWLRLDSVAFEKLPAPWQVLFNSENVVFTPCRCRKCQFIGSKL